MFRDRAEAGRLLGDALRAPGLTRPLVLAIPRGGVVVGEALARAIGGELDVVLARKLRSPIQPELALGSIGEDGVVVLDERVRGLHGAEAGYLEREIREQAETIQRRAALIRRVRPRAEVAGRSVIVTDDGLATGSTMIAALRCAKARGPKELIAAIPVAAPDRLSVIERLCDRVVCLSSPPDFFAIGQFYERFEQVEDDEALRIIERSAGHEGG